MPKSPLSRLKLSLLKLSLLKLSRLKLSRLKLSLLSLRRCLGLLWRSRDSLPLCRQRKRLKTARFRSKRLKTARFRSSQGQ